MYSKMNNLNAIWIILFTLTCLENSFAAKQDSPRQASLARPRPQINVNQESGGFSGFVVVLHSQSANVPQCPVSTVTLWYGYSLINTEGAGKSFHQDLGSCVKRFSTMPFAVCYLNNTCHYASRKDRSYWLTTDAPIPGGALVDSEILNYISRCAVCESPRNVIAVHSQTNETPDCPIGWKGLWLGYSFLMYTGSEMIGGAQSLSSPASCLEKFMPNVFIACNESGICMFTKDHISYWMINIRDSAQFQSPQPIPFTADDLMVGRCQVCQKITR